MKRLTKRLIAWVAAPTMRAIQRYLTRKSPEQVERFGTRFGRLYWHLDRRRRVTCQNNLRLAFPDMPADEAARIAKKVFEHFGRAGTDFLMGAKRSRADLESSMTVVGIEKLENALEAGKGVLLVTGHFGNFERIPDWLSMHGYKISIVVRDANEEGVNHIVYGLRQGLGTELIARGNAAIKIVRRLRDNGIVAITPDQNAYEAFLPFFGKPAGTTLGPGVISDRTGAAVVPVFCRYVGPSQYRMEFHDPLTPYSGYDAKGEGMMRAINDKLESVIRETPEQWLWLHDRWRAARLEGLL